MDVDKLACERLTEWQQGGRPGPLQLFVFPTFRCNLNCAICSRHWYDDPRIGGIELTEERLFRLVEESAALGTKMWTIGGGGEPMTRRHTVLELCRRIKAHGMAGSLQTNGTLLSLDSIDELVRLDWEQVTVSIDGCSAESSDRLRFPRAFEKATEAMRRFSAAKKRQGRDRPYVTVGCVLSRFNSDQMCEMVEMVHELGGNALLFIEMIVYAPEMKELAPTEDQRSRLRQQFERAKGIGERLGVAVSLAATPPGEAPPVVVRQTGHNPYWQALCVEPWLNLVVLSGGRCAPCCVFGEGTTESLQEKSLEEIWFGRDMERMRRQVMDGTAPKDCAVCQAQYVSRRAYLLALLDPVEAFRLDPLRLAEKVLGSLRRNGFRTTLARGRQWIQLRRRYRDRKKA